MLSSRRAVLIAGLALLTVALRPTIGFGFAGDEHRRHDINRLDAPLLQKSVDDAAIVAKLQTSPAWLEWSREHPGWRVTWNTRTRTPHRAFGPGVQITGFGPLTQDNIEAACRRFLQQTSTWTGIRNDELRLLHARKRLDRWYVVFQQTVNGIPVRGGRADLRLGPNGEVMLLGSDWYPEAPVVGDIRISGDAALAAALTDLQAQPEDVLRGRILVPRAGGAAGYRLAHELRFRTRTPVGNWYCLVDGEHGDLLVRENLVRFVNVDGRITADVEPATPEDVPTTLPLRDTRFDIEDGSTEFGYTDIDGNFSVETTAIDTVNVSHGLEGSFARIVNASLNAETPRQEARVLPGSAQDFHWDDSNSRASERDAYYHTLYNHNWIKELDPAFTGVDYQMPVVVDIPTRECNAFYDGFAINFLEAGENCVNTARIADVVYHEYGHAVTDYQYRPLRPSGAMHEAFSDYIAATMTDQPVIGRGFRGPNTAIRSVDNTRRFPDDISGEVHNDGLILGGALWDLRQAVGAAETDVLWHFARYGVADNFDDYMLDVLVTDDDNANIYDGTPNFDAIITAFMAHGIGDYSVQIAHAPEPDTEDLAKPLDIEATILSIFALDPATVLLHYRVDGGDWQMMSLVESGPGTRIFGATIPPQASGSTVDYYVTAADTLGSATTLPASAPEQPFSFAIGPDTTPPTITFRALANRPLDALTWPVRARITDNLDRDLSSVRIEYSRNSMALDQSIDLVRLDDTAWVANIPVGNGQLGDEYHYRIVATDGAATANVTIEPETGTHSFQVVQGYLRDLEDTDGGFSAVGVWEWGAPTSGPEEALSGNNVWATVLDGPYPNNDTSNLQLPSMDLGTWGRASLVFWHWISAEGFFDGGRVEISTNGGSGWSTLHPNRGYPWGFLDVFDGPGYSGETNGWRLAEFDLSQYLGQVVDVRLRFASDAGIVDLGWYVDDVEFVERQVLSVPLRLSASSGEDLQVSLFWQPPAGIDPLQVDTPLQGYNLYRSTSPELTDAVQLNTTLLDSPSYVDNDVVNGTWYYYTATAVYADGESDESFAAAALPYRSSYVANTDQLIVVSESAAVDTAITLTNEGTGFLNVDLWLGDAGDTIDDVRIAYELPAGPASKGAAFDAGAPVKARAEPSASGGVQPSRQEVLAGFASGEMKLPESSRSPSPATPTQDYVVLYNDTSEPAISPDLHTLEAKTEGGSIFFKVTGYEPWGNILTDFTIIIAIDADADLSTGDQQGVDYFVLVGAFPMLQFNAPAFIATFDQRFAGIPNHVVVPPNAAFMEVGFAIPILGAPRRIFTSYFALSPDLSTQIDVAPNLRAIQGWLTPAASHVVAPEGQPTELGLSFADGLPPDAYEGSIFMETNAPDTPEVQLPVTYLFGVTPVELYDLTAVQERDDVVVRWRTSLEDAVSHFRVYRARGSDAFAALHPDVDTQSDRRYVFHDRSPEPGRYTYRVAEVGTDGAVTLHAGVEIEVTQATPLRAFLDPNTPNPFNPSTTFRYGVAQTGRVRLDVYDARGRHVRKLVDDPNVVAGFYRQQWSGLDDRGRRVASGVYHARLIVNGEAFHRRLTLLK